MSAIGDYIHRSLRGYRGRGKSPHISEARIAYAAKKQEIEQQLTITENNKKLNIETKKLEIIMNNFLNKVSPDWDYDELLEEFNNDFFRQEYPQYIADNFLQISKAKNINNIKQIDMTKESIQIATIYNKLDKFKKLLDSLTGILDKNKAQEIEKYYQNLTTDFNNLLKANNIQSQKSSKQINIKQNADFIQQVNELINKLHFSKGLKYAKGRALELFAPFLVQKINEIATEKAYFTIADKLGGKEGKHIPGLSKKLFSDKMGIDFAQVMNKKKEKIDETSDFIASISMPTEDKVDFYLGVNQSDQIIGFSAKNYKVSSEYFKGISLVTGQSLLTLLQNENEGSNFVNHYLTLIQPLNCEGEKNINWIKTYQKNYNRLVFKLVLLKGLTGYNVLKYDKPTNSTVTTDIAEYLIINDSATTTNNIRIISTKKILQQLIKDINSVTLDIAPNSYGYESFANFTLSNKPYGDSDGLTASQRITDILAKAHAQKLHMAMKPDFVKQQIFGYNTTASKT